MGNDKSLNGGAIKLLLAYVYADGDSSATLIDPATAGALPQGYTVYNGIAYDISTEASISGPHIVTFNIPTITDPAIFNKLRILHGEEGVLVDRTILSPDNLGPDFAAKTISARVDSLSPFVIALVGENTDTTAPVITAPTNINVAIAVFK